MTNEKQHLFDNPRNVRRLIHGLVALCAALLAADWVIHRHVSHDLEGIWGFYALYGFVACVLLVLVAREMRKLVMRPEDYYQAGGETGGRRDKQQSTTADGRDTHD